MMSCFKNITTTKVVISLTQVLLIAQLCEGKEKSSVSTWYPQAKAIESTYSCC